MCSLHFAIEHKFFVRLVMPPQNNEENAYFLGVGDESNYQLGLWAFGIEIEAKVSQYPLHILYNSNYIIEEKGMGFWSFRFLVFF